MAAQIDRHHAVPFIRGLAGEAQRRTADAHIQQQPVQAAQPPGGAGHHGLDRRRVRNIRPDREGAAAFFRDRRNRLIGGRPGDVRTGHMGAFAGIKDGRRPAVANGRIGVVDIALAAAHHQDSAAGKPAPSGSAAGRLVEEGAAGLLRHGVPCPSNFRRKVTTLKPSRRS